MAERDPRTIKADAHGHRTRFSDSSFYDEVCILCGATDEAGSRSLYSPCPKAIEDEPLSFEGLRAANFERDKEWAKGQEVGLLFRATELAGEVGEALNVVKKIERAKRNWVGSRATKEDLAEELADAIICVDLLAMEAGIDLADSVRRKFNGTSIKRGFKTRIK